MAVIVYCFSIQAMASQLDALIGHWYGEKQQGPQTHKFLVSRQADGNFDMTFKVYIDDYILMDRSQTGNWSVEHDIYTTKTTEITDVTGTYQPQTPEGYYLDQYTIIEITEEQIIYQHTGSGSRYTLTRVEEGFEF